VINMFPTTGFTRWGAVAGLLTLLLSLAAWRISGGAVFSPGPLSAAKSRNVTLGGIGSHDELGGRCPACHATPGNRATMSARCLGCHTEIHAELGDSSGLHGTLDEGNGCLTCHTEHGGRTSSLTRFKGDGLAHDRLGFSLAAHRRTAAGASFRCRDCHFADSFRFDAATCASCHRAYQADFVLRHEQEWGDDCRACHDGVDRFSHGRFTHDSTRFTLSGRHRTAPCSACHAATRAPAGFRTVQSDCIACHRQKDVHRGEFGSDCAACHGTESWPDARFEHLFPINHGEGGRVACRICHDQAPSYRSYTCYGCHEHAPERVRRKHDEERIANLEDCVRCHRTGSEHEGEGRGHEGGRREHEREGHEHDDD
jgi:hypothetical protein